LTKKPLPYTREFDRAEWKGLCDYVSRNLHLKTLRLDVVAGRIPTGVSEDDDDDFDDDVDTSFSTAAAPQQLETPTPSPASSNHSSQAVPASTAACHNIKPISKQEFEFMRRMQIEWDVSVEGVDLEWVEELMQIKGLEDLKVGVVLESCLGIPPRGESERFWVAFSRSVEGGFADWMREVMVGQGEEKRDMRC
jgi:hypothetical protein